MTVVFFIVCNEKCEMFNPFMLLWDNINTL